MGIYKRPMQRSLLLTCSAFMLLMCVVLSVRTYVAFTSWFYGQYNANLAHVIAGVEHIVDVDDLQECIRTGVPSPEFDRLQAILNEYVDDYELAYLYISIPQADGVMVSVCSATSEAERATGEEDWPLMYRIEDYYTPQSIAPYLDAWDKSGITYFETDSDWGRCYTACKPLVASDGQTIALLCADLYTDTLHSQIVEYVLQSILASAAIGVAFVASLLLWLRRDVTHPIQKLEKSARNFAERSHEIRDPSMLSFDDPHINTHNEIESLCNAILQMSSDMQDYVAGILQAERRAQSAREEAEGMSRLAFEDPLTHARSKAAYARMVAALEEKIALGDAEFAVLMVDLNNLKYVNDTFGHESGDKYLTGSCDLIAQVVGEVPVYRTGGDEFVVILQGDESHRVGELSRNLQARFEAAQANESVRPWERYSAACGMAKRRRNESYGDVFDRADRSMYRNKKKMKARMGDDVKQRA